MSTGRTAAQKVGDWKFAFDAIKVELTPDATRNVLATLQTRAPAEGESEAAYLQDQLAIAQQVARIVAANDRTSAIVAAMITQNGVKVPVDYGED